MTAQPATFDPARPGLGGRIIIPNSQITTDGLAAGHLIYSRSVSRPDIGRYTLIDPLDGSGTIDIPPGRTLSANNSYSRNLGQYHVESTGSRVTILVSADPPY